MFHGGIMGILVALKQEQSKMQRQLRGVEGAILALNGSHSASIVERQRGNAAKAADLLALAEPYDFSLDVNYQRAQAYLAAGDSAKAIAELEKLLGDRGAGWWQVYAPLAQLGLARAYALQGGRDESRKAYDEFFSTWKDADPNIPILRQAKAEYKKLAATASAVTSASVEKQ
jgi:predicted Zn-dependent protease